LADHGVLATAFTFQFDANLLSLHSPLAAVRAVEYLVNIRSKYFQFPTGEQGFALRADDFSQHFFEEGSIMEDAAFAQTIRAHALSSGRRISLMRVPLIAQPHRWTGLGIMVKILVDICRY
jgi:hypothetical protein